MVPLSFDQNGYNTIIYDIAEMDLFMSHIAMNHLCNRV